MNISRFFGATSREAMRQVRLALGPDALIVSNKRVNGGVEILATDQTSLAEDPTPPHAPPAEARDGRRDVRAPARPAAPQAPASTDVMGAIGDLRGALEGRIDELLWGSQLRRSPQAVSLFQSLLRAGFSTALLRAMLKRLPEHLTARAAFQWARDELVSHLPVLPAEDALWRPGLALALVGPTGVGKTTTIAKLAARCVRRSGADSLILLTTDTYRIGAHEQLKIYGQMLHVPVHVVQDAQALQRIVQSARPDQTLLVDNVGISQRDRYVADQAMLLASAGQRVERLLVLNASSHGDTLDEVARSYSGDGGTPLRGCIVTKIDEAPRLGMALDAAIRYQLPIHYVSNGQKVPENLLFLGAAELVDRALAPARSNRTLYAPTEADLAALLAVTPAPEDAQAAAERRRQQTLLPTLLTRTASGESLAMDQLQAAVALQDEDLVLSEAYDLWRSRSAGKLPPAAQTLAHLRRTIQGEIDLDRPGFVTHVHQAQTLRGLRGVWSGAAWFDALGHPLGAGRQQVLMPDGGYTPEGGQPVHLSLAEAVREQILLEDQGAAGKPWHVFGGGSQRLLRALEARGCCWLSACGARQRIFQDGEAGVFSAAARQLNFQPLGPRVFMGLRGPAGLTPATTTWWAGLGDGALHARGADPLQVRVFCLRAVDSASGRIQRAWYALAGRGAHADPALMARALVLRQEMQAAWRQAAALLAEGQDTEPLVDRAAFAAQLGLAAWHLVQSPKLLPAAQVVARMLGADALAPRQARAGLLKLYALKELLSG